MITKIVDISEYKVEFKVGRFFKMFVYHILFFIIGPLVTLLMGIFDSFSLANNACFSPFTNQKFIFFLQLFQWLATVYFFITWGLQYLYPWDDFIGGIYIEELYFFCIHLAIRSFVIAVRYGFASELRYLLMRSSMQDVTFLTKDIFIGNWV